MLATIMFTFKLMSGNWRWLWQYDRENVL